MKNTSKFDKTVLAINKVMLVLAVLIILVPLIYVFIASFMNPNTLLSKGISFNPNDWSLAGYKKIFEDPAIVRGFFNSIIYSVLFTIITVGVCVCAAYPLSRKEFVGRKVIMGMFMVTMFFSGGLIPTYLLVKNLGMLNTVWALVIPGAVSVWNIILARTFFQSIPNEIIEAAGIDGASTWQIFLKIILPLSKPIICVLALYAFVGQWNSYFDAMIYLKDSNLEPLQLVLRRILIQNQPSQGMISDQLAMAELKKISEMIKYSSIVISSVPLMFMYPFFQKYFEKGAMIGSVKG